MKNRPILRSPSEIPSLIASLIALKLIYIASVARSVITLPTIAAISASRYALIADASDI